MTDQKKRILLITCHEDDLWTSISSLRNSFIDYWTQYKDNYQITTLDHINYPFLPSDLIKTAGMDFLIFLRLDAKTAPFLEAVRKSINTTARVISYTEESPSIGFFNYKSLHLELVLKTSDILIAQNKRDQALISLLTNMPSFHVPGMINKDLLSLGKFKGPIKNLCYIGRISPQKNLHTTLWTIGLIQRDLREKGIKLYVFGHQDNLGSPNMGLPSGAYLEELYSYCTKMGILDLVIFEEFQPKIELLYKRILALNCLNISLSLHSDEDFGFSILECCTLGIPSIISNWEGYSNFIDDFPGLVEGVTVNQSEAGPFIDPQKTSELVLSTIEQLHFEVATETEFKKYISPPLIELEALEENKSPMMYTDFARKIHKQAVISPQVKLGDREWPQHGVIYHSYADALVQKIFEVFGAKKLKIADPESNKFELAPWVTNKETCIEIKDPHRGSTLIPKHESQNQWLISNGYIASKVER